MNKFLTIKKKLILLALLAIIGWVLSRTGFLAWWNVDTNWGHFVARPEVRFLEPGRKMSLLNDVTYVDPGGTKWTAPKGYATDGATIPPVFWSFVGGPFSGPYRDAAIIHDWYVETMERTSEDTHRVFYYASRAVGLCEFEAKRLYLAVLVGGRKWGGEDSSCYSACHTIPETYSTIDGKLVLNPSVSEQDAETAMSWLEASDRSFEEINDFVATEFPGSLFGHDEIPAFTTE